MFLPTQKPSFFTFVRYFNLVSLPIKNSSLDSTALLAFQLTDLFKTAGLWTRSPAIQTFSVKL